MKLQLLSFSKYGFVKIASTNHDGREIVAAIGSQGTVLASDIGATVGLRLSCVALTDCRAHRLDKVQFLKHIHRGGSGAIAAFEQSTAMCTKLVSALMDAHTLTARQRLETLLQQLADASPGCSALRLKKRELAELLGISASYLSRITHGHRARSAAI